METQVCYLTYENEGISKYMGVIIHTLYKNEEGENTWHFDFMLTPAEFAGLEEHSIFVSDFYKEFYYKWMLSWIYVEQDKPFNENRLRQRDFLYHATEAFKECQLHQVKKIYFQHNEIVQTPIAPTADMNQIKLSHEVAKDFAARKLKKQIYKTAETNKSVAYLVNQQEMALKESKRNTK